MRWQQGQQADHHQGSGGRVRSHAHDTDLRLGAAVPAAHDAGPRTGAVRMPNSCRRAERAAQ
ncbi:hypothetical protein ABZ408_28210 [Streptomyces tibetensis]|uniref:hypothetical protein n=1 Tax=Streptomyces tibetensis TaxID=2382123 RepID=UPI0033C8A988